MGSSPHRRGAATDPDTTSPIPIFQWVRSMTLTEYQSFGGLNADERSTL